MHDQFCGATCEVGVFMDKTLFIPFTVLPWNHFLLFWWYSHPTALALYLQCTLIQGALLLDTGQPWKSQSNSGDDNSSLRQRKCLYCSLWNCFNNDTISPPLCTVSSPLAKPGKLLPLVSLSQEKKSGTNIQMITELGKLSLCPLLPFVPSLRRSAPHQLVLIYLAAVKVLAAPMASLWTHFYSSFWLKLTVLFWPLFNDFFFLFGVVFFFFLQLRLQSIARPLIMLSLSLWLFS